MVSNLFGSSSNGLSHHYSFGLRHTCFCPRAENRTSKMQVFDVSHMGGFVGVGPGGVITFLASVSR